MIPSMSRHLTKGGEQWHFLGVVQANKKGCQPSADPYENVEDGHNRDGSDGLGWSVFRESARGWGLPRFCNCELGNHKCRHETADDRQSLCHRIIEKGRGVSRAS